MMDILKEEMDFLLQKFQTVEPCTPATCSASYLVWVKIFNVPVKVWGYEFFEAVTAPLGRTICRDDPTRDR